MLQSKHNQRLKYVRRLVQRKFRESERKFVIEGIRFLEEAVKVNWPLDLVLYTTRAIDNTRGRQLMELLAEQGVPSLAVDDSLFFEVANTDTPQGMLAVAQMPPKQIFDASFWADKENDLFLLVDGIRDPGNLGTVIRCADAAGVNGVILMKGVVDPYNPKTLRSTMGSVFHVPLYFVEDWDLLINDLQLTDWKLVVGDLAAEKMIDKCDLTTKVVLVVGSEADGVSDAVKLAAGEKVYIPMPGRAESLNAGVAAGIMLYETVRQRTNIGKNFARKMPSFFR